MDYYARSAGESGERQLLRDHLLGVAERTAAAAEAAGIPRSMGEWAGLLHDLGKYSDEFQELRLGLGTHRVEHACHGAAIAAEAGALDIAFAVLGHHAGLKSREELRELLRREHTFSSVDMGKVIDRARECLERARSEGLLADLPGKVQVTRDGLLDFELRTRLLLSCLADADRLDAEAWMDRSKPLLRDERRGLSAAEALAAVRQKVGALAASTPDGEVKRVRAEVFEACLRAGNQDPGFFSLTVPTGGGKTLASLAFALAHAKAHRLRRVILVVPFITIIEQNARAIREALNGTAFVLEHHSNVIDGGDDEGQQQDAVARRLLSENWEAPVIITTSVQFFESLFAAHPSRVRKIHNIARSVVVFDEVQTFPPGMLKPITGMLNQLRHSYGCSFVFCTATQPALNRPLGERQETLVAGEVREIAPHPDGLARRLRRVAVTWPDGETTLDVVAEAMAAERQALAVVNLKREARALFRALRGLGTGAFHLSTRMCGAHRLEVIDEIRRRLQEGEPCRVASTQLIEAGVDVDFPALWRAFGPLDSVAQAAGRCNREGRLDAGRVTVFRPEGSRMPSATYQRAADTTAALLRERGELDISAPGLFGDYFVRFYNTGNLDERSVVQSRRDLRFEDVAHDFRVIDDPTQAVLVPFGEGRSLVERLKGEGAPWPGLHREAQRFTVGLYPGELKGALEAGAVFEIGSTGVLACREDAYDRELGLVQADDAGSYI